MHTMIMIGGGGGRHHHYKQGRGHKGGLYLGCRKKDVAQKWPPLRVSCEREPNLVRNTCSPNSRNWNEHTVGHTGREKRKTSTEKQL